MAKSKGKGATSRRRDPHPDRDRIEQRGERRLDVAKRNWARVNKSDPNKVSISNPNLPAAPTLNDRRAQLYEDSTRFNAKFSRDIGHETKPSGAGRTPPTKKPTDRRAAARKAWATRRAKGGK